MPKQSTATAFDHDSTLVLALELSGKGDGRSGLCCRA